MPSSNYLGKASQGGHAKTFQRASWAVEGRNGHLSQMHHHHRGFPKRFGSSINLNLHYHLIVLEGSYLDRSAQGLKPKFGKLAPPSDADIAAVVTKIAAPGRDRDASQTGLVSLGVGTLTQAHLFPQPGVLSARSLGPLAEPHGPHLPACHAPHLVPSQAGG